MASKVIVAFMCKNKRRALWIKNKKLIHLYKPVE